MVVAAPLQKARAEPLIDIESSKGVTMSARDQALTRQALWAAAHGRWNEGKQAIALTKNVLPGRLFFWLYYTRGMGPVDFRHVMALIRECPDWPKQGMLRTVAEKAMPLDLPDQAVVAWYRDYPPKTFDAEMRYLGALQRQGNTPALDEAAGNWWRAATMTPDQQARFYNTYARHLKVRDHLARMDGQLRGGAETNARIIAQTLGHGYPALVLARIALAEDAPNADSLVAAVPGPLQRDPGLLYERVKWRRIHNYDLGAIEMLHNMPPAETVPNLSDWWTERQIIARRLMSRGDYRSAYYLVSDHIDKEGSAFAQAEFLAGWLALIYLKEPWKAFQHFEALYKSSDTSTGKSRAAYWAGRASDALGHPEVGRRWYQAAARSQTAFYGQLAIGRLANEYKPPQQLPPRRSVAGQNRFNKLEMVQAARLLNQAGFRQETTDFLNALSDEVTTPEEYLYVAELSRDLDHLQNAVRIARKGLNKGIFLMDSAFPTILKRMRGIDIEWALVHGIIRQESAFDFSAVSSAGARGMMQVMPGTAADVARKLGIPFRPDALTADPNYNIRIGSAYMKHLLDIYDGSYPLAVAAYNAGPARVSGWVRDTGDPRTGQIDNIDWIEQIPIAETRNYVQRVLEAVYIYRIKLRDVQKSYNAPLDSALDR